MAIIIHTGSLQFASNQFHCNILYSACRTLFQGEIITGRQEALLQVMLNTSFRRQVHMQVQQFCALVLHSPQKTKVYTPYPLFHSTTDCLSTRFTQSYIMDLNS